MEKLYLLGWSHHDFFKGKFYFILSCSQILSCLANMNKNEFIDMPISTFKGLLTKSFKETRLALDKVTYNG